MRAPTASFEHVATLTDEIGSAAHVDHARPRPSRGYDTEDMARLLIATTREPTTSAWVDDLAATARRFLADAQGEDGAVREHRDVTGGWSGGAVAGTAWGRSVQAWGLVVRLGGDARIRRQATACFRRAATRRSPSVHAAALAALGAAEVLAARPHYDDARALLADVVDRVGPIRDDAAWPWPQDRLGEGDAVLCEALIAAGSALQRPEVLEDGLRLLDWLLERQTRAGHLSPTPAGGAGPDGPVTGFDQRPAEVAALADACARAFAVTRDHRWQRGVALAAGWFAGDNDGGAQMWDGRTDGAYDVLSATGPSPDQGVVATLAMITTSQQARACATATAGSR